jgi:hypothetical protein
MGIIGEIIRDIIGIIRHHQNGGGGNGAPCFRAGTTIRTPRGEVAIESIKVGDLVSLADGSAVRVTKVLKETVRRGSEWSDQLAPVRVEAGAIAANEPSRTLEVSPNHAIFYDGCLVRAADLVNGGSIRQVAPEAESFEYYNLQLDAHALIVANDLVVESFRDYVRNELPVAPLLGNLGRKARATKTIRTLLRTPGSRRLAAVRAKLDGQSLAA